MKRRSQTPQETYLLELLDERFARVHDRFDVIEKRVIQRELDQNMMDTAQHAEAKAIKDQIEKVGDAFRDSIEALDQRVQTLEWILKSALWLVSTVAAGVALVAGIWKSIRAH